VLQLLQMNCFFLSLELEYYGTEVLLLSDGTILLETVAEVSYNPLSGSISFISDVIVIEGFEITIGAAGLDSDAIFTSRIDNINFYSEFTFIGDGSLTNFKIPYRDFPGYSYLDERHSTCETGQFFITANTQVNSAFPNTSDMFLCICYIERTLCTVFKEPPFNRDYEFGLYAFLGFTGPQVCCFDAPDS